MAQMCANVCLHSEIIKKMDLEGKVTAKQAAKKWENLKKKYKVCYQFLKPWDPLSQS